MPKKKIVILGAGFGGLRAALVLGKKLKNHGLAGRYEVLLIDQNDHHTYTPLLYEVATTSKESANLCELHDVATYPIASLINGLPVTFLRTTVEAIDIANGLLVLESEELQADYLVLALGSETNYFDIPGLKQHALPFKNFFHALVIRDTIWNMIMEGAKDLKIVIGGGGPSGVELAGEIKSWYGELHEAFPSCGFTVTIVEANSSILSGLDPSVIRIAKERLRSLGVTVFENKKVSRAEETTIILEDGSGIPYDVLIWTGGVKAPSLLSRMPLKAEAHGRVEVAGGLECLPQTPDLSLHTKIYALGDSICFYHPVTKQPIPGVARAAISQANVVAHNIIEDICAEEDKRHIPRHHTYVPRRYPYITPVGGKYAIVKLGPLVFAGFSGWILKGLVEFNYLLSIMSPWRALRIWIKGLSIFIKNDRLG